MDKRKKRMIGILIMLCVISILVGVAVLLINNWTERQGDQIYYYPEHMFVTPDASVNILEDQEYLALDREIYYTADNITLPIKDEDSEISQFWINYFSAIQHGDAVQQPDHLDNKGGKGEDGGTYKGIAVAGLGWLLMHRLSPLTRDRRIICQA